MEHDIELLYRLYAKELYFFIFSICKNESLSQDILQITFIQAIKGIEGFKGKASIKTWLFSIAKFQCYQQFRKDKNHICIDEVNIMSIENMAEDIISNLCSEEIVKQINELKEPDRSIVLLRILAEYSFAEIGKLVNKSENYCRVIYYRAKNKLRKELKEYE